MSVATLNIKVSPRRMLTPREAAEYCGIAAKRFPVECQVLPIEMPNGSKLYDMRDLDSWLDGLKGGDVSGDDEIVARLG